MPLYTHTQHQIEWEEKSLNITHRNASVHTLHDRTLCFFLYFFVSYWIFFFVCCRFVNGLISRNYCNTMCDQMEVKTSKHTHSHNESTMRVKRCLFIEFQWQTDLCFAVQYDSIAAFRSIPFWTFTMFTWAIVSRFYGIQTHTHTHTCRNTHADTPTHTQRIRTTAHSKYDTRSGHLAGYACMQTRQFRRREAENVEKKSNKETERESEREITT